VGSKQVEHSAVDWTQVLAAPSSAVQAMVMLVDVGTTGVVVVYKFGTDNERIVGCDFESN
jgi:hypothetical protein